MSEFKIIWGGDVLTANTSCEANFLGVGNYDHKELLESKFLDGDTLKEDEPNDTTADVYILEEDGSTKKLHVFPTRSQDGIVATYKIDNDGDSCKLLNDTNNIWYKELDITQESGAMFTVIADYDDWANIQSPSSRIVDNSASKDWFSFPQRGDRVCKFKFKTNDQAATNASMFMGCTSLKSVVLPYSITSISANTFNGCSNLVSYGDVDHITSIGDYAFSDCTSLTTAEFGKFLLKTSTGNQLGDAAFSGCTSLTNINYYIEYGYVEPDDCHALNIPNNCFKGCTSLKGSNGKTQLDIYGNVGAASFSGCTSLKKVSLSNSVTSIGSNAFNGCTILENVTINRTIPPHLGANAFNSTHSNLVIYVPSASVNAYKAASGWSVYASRIQAIQ